MMIKPGSGQITAGKYFSTIYNFNSVGSIIDHQSVLLIMTCYRKEFSKSTSPKILILFFSIYLM